MCVIVGTFSLYGRRASPKWGRPLPLSSANDSGVNAARPEPPRSSVAGWGTHTVENFFNRFGLSWPL